mgnify:FL=1
MTIKWQLAKAKKTTVLLTRLKEMAMAEDKINYAIAIEKRIVVSKNKVIMLTRQLETVNKQNNWFAFLAR